MGLYNKTSLQMLVDLLNASNPSLPVPIDLTQVKFGVPSVVTPTSGAIQDTKVKVLALAAGQYVGNTNLTYRRVNLTNLFRSVPLRIDLYSPAATNASPFTMAQLLPYINAKYGLNLQASDITSINFPAGNTSANVAYGVPAGTRNAVAALTIVSTNPAWSPISINVCWVQAPQDLATLLAVPSLETALTYPGARDVVDSTVYVPNLDTYYLDFTDPLTSVYGLASSVPQYGGSALSAATPFLQLIAAIAAVTGKAYTLGQGNPAGSVLLDLTGATITYVDLTTAANQALYPEADFLYYNRMLVIKLQTINSWGAGEMMLHFNV